MLPAYFFSVLNFIETCINLVYLNRDCHKFEQGCKFLRHKQSILLSRRLSFEASEVLKYRGFAHYFKKLFYVCANVYFSASVFVLKY